ncbi:hypothetical protein GOODEAATRI_009651, partial [Goodea atripinnis]
RSACRVDQISGAYGWWGERTRFLTSLHSCRTENYVPGLHLLTFQHPRNDSQPDKTAQAWKTVLRQKWLNPKETVSAICCWHHSTVLCVRSTEIALHVLSECLSNSSQCAWCESAQACFYFAAYLTKYPYGECRDWYDRCLRGDWAGIDDLSVYNCSVAVAEARAAKLGLHNCHPFATCINTPTSYECHCERGYTGDGTLHCNQTYEFCANMFCFSLCFHLNLMGLVVFCYNECREGQCSGSPRFECECSLGWTSDPATLVLSGVECDVDCGCNFHSTCITAPGICDECQGSFGSALAGGGGCIPCECNGHGDLLQGYCHNQTGQCYCTHNTQGPHFYFEANVSSNKPQGFNASFWVRRCQQSSDEDEEGSAVCAGGAQCQSGLCQCPQGYGGAYCDRPMCPQDCGAAEGRGVCNIVSYRFHVETVEPSGELYGLYYPNLTWSLLVPSQGKKPLSRFFHAAALIKDTMVIVGGRTEAEDYSNSVSLYQINCNTWIQPDSAIGDPVNRSVSLAMTSWGGRLFLSGGFNGVTLGRLLTLTVPSDPCALLPTPEACNTTTEHDCRINQREIFLSSNCTETSCEASDCPKCTASGKCMWTRQFKRTGETRRILSVNPTYDWTCFSYALLNVSPMQVESSPPLPCPPPCHTLHNCSLCLGSRGSDGGWQHCVSEGVCPVRNSSWSFLHCPEEDECANGHHHCNSTQDCHDLPEGYHCTCKQGYILNRGNGVVCLSRDEYNKAIENPHLFPVDSIVMLDFSFHCRCQCNGHADTCEPDGSGCPCQNNTETSSCLSKFCFDPTSQTNCFHDPTIRNLPKGRTVFFAAQPKFTNVDIRVTIDVTFGEVEVYVSNSHDTFIVDVDRYTGIHTIKIEDESMSRGTATGSDKDSPPSPIKVFGNASANLGGPVLSHNPLQLQAKLTGGEREIRDERAEGLISYITVWKPQTVLIVRGVRDRVVITFPHEVHSLKSSRFYIALRGVGTDERQGESQGLLFVRQDQAHIDLFVFFSVFFSCFFLFLSVCVLLWKVKQFLDFRREQRRHIQEMTKMASRPFAKLTIYLEPEEPQLIYLPSAGGGVGGGTVSVAHARTGKLSGVVVGQRGRGGPVYKHDPGSGPTAHHHHHHHHLTLSGGGSNGQHLPLHYLNTHHYASTTAGTQSSHHHHPSTYSGYQQFCRSDPFLSQLMGFSYSSFKVGPITLEPTEDGMAGVATVLFQLPGGVLAPNRACLGSALVTLRQNLQEYCGHGSGSGHPGAGAGRKGLHQHLTTMAM